MIVSFKDCDFRTIEPSDYRTFEFTTYGPCNKNYQSLFANQETHMQLYFRQLYSPQQYEMQTKTSSDLNDI